MKVIFGLISSHGTRLLGIAQGTIAILCGIVGLIPENQLKYWMAASAVLTFWRGQFVSNQVNNLTVPTLSPILEKSKS
jgi:hypothetical protein